MDKDLLFWEAANKKVLDNIFSGKIMKFFSKDEAKDYITRLVNECSAAEKRKPLSRKSLRIAINAYLKLMGMDASINQHYEDIEYRFDIIAKGKKNIIIDINPELAHPKEYLQYMHNLLADSKKFMFFFATDVLNLGILNPDNPENIIIKEHAKNNMFGIIFADMDDIYIIPSEFLGLE